MPPKSARGPSQPSLLPPLSNLVIWDDLPVQPDPTPPLPLEPYDEAAQLAAPRGVALRALLEEDERATSEYAGELARLQSDLSRKTRDTTDMVKYLEAEVRRKDLMSKRMTRQLADLQTNHEEDLAMIKKQFENTCKYMEKIFMKKEEQILQKNQQLEEQIQGLAEFQQMRAALSAELESTKAVIFHHERTHKLQLDELEKRFLSARDGLQREAAARIANSRATYKAEVGRELEAESTAVRLENEKLRDRLRTHEATSDRLQRENATLTTRIHALKQDLELRQQQSEEYLRKGRSQAKQIDAVTGDTKAMEEELMRALRDRDQAREARDQQQQSLVAPLHAQLNSSRLYAGAVDSENRRLRRGARRVLREKRETERFFLSALEETRANLSRKRALQKREHQLLQQAQLRELTLPTALRTKLPFIQGASDNAPYSATIFHAPQVDLGDLTLEDREKVLRLLYAKIAHVPSGVVANLPPHSFDIQLAGGTSDRTTPALPESRPRSLPPSQPTTAQAMPHAQLDDGTAASADVPQLMPATDDARAEYDMTFLTNMQPDDDDDDDEGDTDSDSDSPRQTDERDSRRPIIDANATD